MPEDFEAHALVTDAHRSIVVRPAAAGRVWLKIVDGLDADNEVAVDPVLLAAAMKWVDEQNPRGEE